MANKKTVSSMKKNELVDFVTLLQNKVTELSKKVQELSSTKVDDKKVEVVRLQSGVQLDKIKFDKILTESKTFSKIYNENKELFIVELVSKETKKQQETISKANSSKGSKSNKDLESYIDEATSLFNIEKKSLKNRITKVIESKMKNEKVEKQYVEYLKNNQHKEDLKVSLKLYNYIKNNNLKRFF